MKREFSATVLEETAQGATLEATLAWALQKVQAAQEAGQVVEAFELREVRIFSWKVQPPSTNPLGV